MKNFLINFILKNWLHCILMLYMLEPIFRDQPNTSRIFNYGMLLIFILFLIYFVIKFFKKALFNEWAPRQVSKESILLDVYICGLIILAQYLTTTDMSVFISNISECVGLVFLCLIDLIPDKKTISEENG